MHHLRIYLIEQVAASLELGSIKVEYTWPRGASTFSNGESERRSHRRILFTSFKWQCSSHEKTNHQLAHEQDYKFTYIFLLLPYL